MTHTSPGNLVEFNQSEDDWSVAKCIRRSANRLWAWRLRLRLAFPLHFFRKCRTSVCPLFSHNKGVYIIRRLSTVSFSASRCLFSPFVSFGRHLLQCGVSGVALWASVRRLRGLETQYMYTWSALRFPRAFLLQLFLLFFTSVCSRSWPVSGKQSGNSVLDDTILPERDAVSWPGG